MRTLGVCLLASGISFNALATDISEVVVNYDGNQPIHKYLKNTDRNAAISAIPQIIEARFEKTRNCDRIKLEMALLANSKQIKNAKLNTVLQNSANTASSSILKRLYQYSRLTAYQNDPPIDDNYAFNTQVSEDDVISCAITKSNGEESLTITDFGVSSFDRKTTINSVNLESYFDKETAYFAEQAILKEAIKISRNNTNLLNDPNLPNTIIAVDFTHGATDYQKRNIYQIMMHYTIPGAFNKVNIANFKYMLTQQLLKDEAIDTSVFYNFLLHPHFIELTHKNEEIRDLHYEICQNKLFERNYLNSCEKMVDLLADKYLALYNNHIIAAYLCAVGGVNNVVFIPKTLYQLISLEGLTRNEIYGNYNVDVSDTFYQPKFETITQWLKSYDVDNYRKYMNLLSLTNDNTIKYTKNRCLNSIVYKVIKDIKKNRFIAISLDKSTTTFSKLCNMRGYSRLFSASSNSYTSIGFYNAIAKFIDNEYNAPEGTWRVYHGCEYTPKYGGPSFEITKEYSSSFSDGLFSGIIHDASDGCAARATFYRGACYYYDVSIADHINNRSNVYIPSVHTIIPMFGKGELHHVRTKVYHDPMKKTYHYGHYSYIPGIAPNRDDNSKCRIDVMKLSSLFTEDPSEVDNVSANMITNVNMRIWDYIVRNKPKELD